MKFPNPFVFKPNGTPNELVLEDIDDLRRFSDAEVSAWGGMLAQAMSEGPGFIRSIAEQAANFLKSFQQQVSNLEALFTPDEGVWQQQQTQRVVGQINFTLNQFANGVPWITSSSYLGLKVSALGKTHPTQAIALWMIENDGASNILGTVGQGVDVQTLLRTTRYLGEEAVPSTTDLPGVEGLRSDYQAELSLLKRKFDETRTDFDKFFEKVNEAHLDENATFAKMEAAWVEKTKSTFDDIDTQWEKMQLTFNTQLALRAPTTYWKEQSESSRHRLWASAAVFVVAGAVSLGAFLYWGLPYLANPGAVDKSVILHVLPIVIPAFIVIWIMKILSKLMSGYLQRADDANERRVMVMTFLALMNKDDFGAALVNDQDRILILHALFRPSAVSPTDDAPPVHWFDLLTSRMQK
jgi:Family of unknown function (DUF6161)